MRPSTGPLRVKGRSASPTGVTVVLALTLGVTGLGLPPARAADDPALERPAEALAAPHLVPPDSEGDASQDSGAKPCVAGLAGPFACREVDLLAQLSLDTVSGGTGATLASIWGWTDLESGREFALVPLSDGLAFVEVTVPTAPSVVGWMPTQTIAAPWRDVKVFDDRAYVIADGVGLHGMQVFDLRRLMTNPGGAPVMFAPDFVYYGVGFGLAGGEILGSAHTIAVNEETGFVYVVGARSTCAGGLHMVDVREIRPRFAGCFADDGYTHEVQCVVYRGPDAEHQGRELCFAANEDTITVVDVTEKRAPRQLSRVGYEGSAYVHQAWLTEDHQYLISNDELDEIEFGHGSRSYVWDVRDVDGPRLIGVRTAASSATDHNLYVRGDLVYEANYRSGLRILSLDEVASGALTEVAFFDVDPTSDEPGFDGAWSVYPFFASGNVVVSGITQGLFVLRPHPRDAHQAEAER